MTNRESTLACDANGSASVRHAAGDLTTYSWDIENHLTVETRDSHPF
jgi:hypothetical protein